MDVLACSHLLEVRFKPSSIGNSDKISGVPHPDYFPFVTLEATTLPTDAYSTTPRRDDSTSSPLAWLWNLFSGPNKSRLGKIVVPKYVSDPINEVNLATGLQYGRSSGGAHVNSKLNFTYRNGNRYSTITGVPQGILYEILQACLLRFRDLSPHWEHRWMVASCLQFAKSRG
jgi:hypothetical protein